MYSSHYMYIYNFFYHSFTYLFLLSIRYRPESYVYIWNYIVCIIHKHTCAYWREYIYIYETSMVNACVTLLWQLPQHEGAVVSFISIWKEEKKNINKKKEKFFKNFYLDRIYLFGILMVNELSSDLNVYICICIGIYMFMYLIVVNFK